MRTLDEMSRTLGLKYVVSAFRRTAAPPCGGCVYRPGDLDPSVSDIRAPRRTLPTA
jgi:hypothetical protein